MKLPRPSVPRGVAIGLVFRKLRKVIDVFLHSMRIVWQRGSGLLLFHDGALDTIAPRCLPLLEVVPEAHRLGTFFGLARDDVANVDSIKFVWSVVMNSGHRH